MKETEGLITKIILYNIYFFSFGLFLSKALTSLTGGLIVIFWLIKVIKNKRISLKGTYLDKAILFFLIGIVFSLFDVWDMVVIDEILKYVLTILLFYIIINTINNINQLKKILYFSFSSLIIASTYGIYQHYALSVDRVGSFMSVLDFGGLLAISIVFLSAFIIWGDIPNRERVLYFILDLLCIVNLVFTKTRGAWLAFIFGIFALFAIKKKSTTVVLLIVLVGIFFFLPDVYTDRFLSSFNLANSSNMGRIALWKGSILMFQDHFINGVGLGLFQKEYENFYIQPNTVTTVHAHNNYLHFIAEAGIIGFFGLTYLMIIILKMLYKYFINSDKVNVKLFFLSSFIAVLVFNIHGLTEFNFGDTDTLRFFWFLLSINIAVFKVYDKTKSNLGG